MASWFSCKPCAGSDPTQDTVKVNIQDMLDKENVQPVQLATKSDLQVDAAKEKKLAEDRRKQAEEEAKRRKEEQAAAEAQRLRDQMKEAAEKVAKEKANQEAEEMAKRKAEEKALWEAEVAAAAAEQERVFQEVQKAQQAQREQDAAAKLAAAQERVNAWCKKNSFRDMNTQKKTIRGATKFPLHTAVKHQNEEMVQLLLKCGVDQQVKDSRKQTPKELAATLSKNGSHDQILGFLR